MANIYHVSSLTPPGRQRISQSSNMQSGLTVTSNTGLVLSQGVWLEGVLGNLLGLVMVQAHLRRLVTVQVNLCRLVIVPVNLH